MAHTIYYKIQRWVLLAGMYNNISLGTWRHKRLLVFVMCQQNLRYE